MVQRYQKGPPACDRRKYSQPGSPTVAIDKGVVAHAFIPKSLCLFDRPYCELEYFRAKSVCGFAGMKMRKIIEFQETVDVLFRTLFRLCPLGVDATSVNRLYLHLKRQLYSS